MSLELISLFESVTSDDPPSTLKPYWSLAVRQLSSTTSCVPSPTPAPVLSLIVLYLMVQFGPVSWLTAMESAPGTKFSMVRYSIVTPVAVCSKAASLTPWPLRMAPGAPMKVSPAEGSICPYCDVPMVWTPGANQ